MEIQLNDDGSFQVKLDPEEFQNLKDIIANEIAKIEE